MTTDSTRGRLLAVALVGVLLVGLVPGVAAAQTGISGNVVIEEGETVSEVNAVTGSVVVHGTVTGDVSGVAGNVHVTGTVEGDVDAAAGNLRISGTVEGDVATGAGDVHLEEGGTVLGDFQVGAGNVRIDGTIEGDAQIGANTIRLGDEAAIGGSLTYDGSLTGNTDAVAGEVTRDSTLGVGLVDVVQPLASWVFALYTFLLNLLLGAAVLALFPRFARGVADRVATDPVRTGLAGLGVLVGVPVLLVAVALTIVGIPLTVFGAFLFAFVAWLGLVLGRFAVGAWLLSLAGVVNRWAALVLGLLVGAVLSQVPVVGGLLNFVIFLLGLGALAWGLYAHRRPESAPPTEPTGGPAAD